MVRATLTTVFGFGPWGGNPCAIVESASALSAEQMRAVARHFGVECGFVTAVDDASVALRFFVPEHEMSMCVHATVAAFTLLGRSGRFELRAEAGTFPVTVALPEVRVRQHPPEFGSVVSEPAELLAALRVSAADVAGPVRAVSVSRSKLIVPLTSEAVVHGLAPDFERLWSACDALSTTGVYAFARVGPGRFQARQFPVRAGYVEDPATGVAAGALAAYLARHEGETAIAIGQGFAMGRPSLLHASASSSGPEVYGSAEVLEVVDVPV